jgi:hypothetical protein
MNMRHPFETDLALYAGRDLTGWKRFTTAWHVRNCADCRTSVESLRDVQQQWADTVDDLPEGVNWDKLSAEMTANIHLGIAAGECVATAGGRAAAQPRINWNWQPAGIAAGLVMVFALAWWLNMPPIKVRPNTPYPVALEDRGPVVAASYDGIQYSENGSMVGVNMVGVNMDAPVAVSVSFNGSASARYVNEDTGVVTIATVYGK